MAKVILIALLSLLKSQEIDWDKKPGQITAIEIFCDTEGIPIFIDKGAKPFLLSTLIIFLDNFIHNH